MKKGREVINGGKQTEADINNEVLWHDWAPFLKFVKSSQFRFVRYLDIFNFLAKIKTEFESKAQILKSRVKQEAKTPNHICSGAISWLTF